VSDAFQTVANPENFERRIHPRLPVSFSCVQLENDNGGIILNISERGLAMQVVRSLPNDSLSEMRFQLSRSDAWIETRGRIAWKDAPKTTAGVEFVCLSYEGQIRLKKSIASLFQSSAPVEEGRLAEVIEVDRSPATLRTEGDVPVPEPEATGLIVEDQIQSVIAEHPGEVSPTVTETRGSETVSEGSAAEDDRPAEIGNAYYAIGSPIALSYEDYEVESGERKPSRRIWFWVVAVLLLSALGYLAFHLQMIASNHQERELTVSATVPELPANNSTSPAKPSADSRPPSIGPSFVLQVGAMTHKDNADRLAESLRKKNFPAFVSHNATDRFYHVIVGPYDDVNSTSRAREELKKQNLDVISQRWNPAATQSSGESHN
jgi:cell division septation protein DedD